jgi:2-polyprenyl-3-methyl-5-hydroxy-6-metoxy-1,4-benzoquinol methylase
MSGTEEASPPRFAFGENWDNFVADVDGDRALRAERSLVEMLGTTTLEGKSFLDVGCGSGLFSLAAARLGAARIHSFDFDSRSVAATRTLQVRYPVTTEWTVEQGDATDGSYCASLGTFDIVYAWGVLHHTGAMWQALENTIARVAPGGSLFLAIYNAQGQRSRRWLAVKKTFNRLPRRLRPAYALVVMLPTEVRTLASAAVRGHPGEYFSEWINGRERGMSRWHDLLDWVGGYPFEVAKPEEIFRFCRTRGLELVELATAGGGLGNNQFVFQRPA